MFFPLITYFTRIDQESINKSLFVSTDCSSEWTSKIFGNWERWHVSRETRHVLRETKHLARNETKCTCVVTKLFLSGMFFNFAVLCQRISTYHWKMTDPVPSSVEWLWVLSTLCLETGAPLSCLRITLISSSLPGKLTFFWFTNFNGKKWLYM